MSAWNALTYEGKDTILRVVRDEAERMFAMAEAPGAWEAPTAAGDWQVRDVIGHIVDTTEGYFHSFEVARAGSSREVHGLPAMHELAGAGGRSFRGVPQSEMMSRVRIDLDKILDLLGRISEEEWGSFMAPHAYMGPVPPSIYAGGQLMDYGVHSWDIRQGSGMAHGLSGDAADLLVPFMFAVWQGTVKTDQVTEPFTIGIRVGGRNAGDYRVSISQDGMTYEPGDVESLPCYIEFDAGSMVLTAFGRGNFGTVRGDLALAEKYLNSFFRI